MSIVFRVLGDMIKEDDKLILFVSFVGKGFNDSPKVIYEYLKKYPQYASLRCVWAFEHPEKFPDLDTVKIDSFQYFRTALKARYWITNTNIERGLRFKKKTQIYLNTWHGIALKKIGNDCPGRKDFNFDTVNYLVVSGKHDERVWKSAFNAVEESYIRCGMPRNDVLWHIHDNTVSRSLRIKLNLPLDKKIILYAPTWRDSQNNGKTYDLSLPIDLSLWKKTLESQYIILFRCHIFTTQLVNLTFDSFFRNYSDYPDINDLYVVSDYLVTDYSSVMFDYSILEKPIFCFAYDYEEYIKDRGMYFNMAEELPNKPCATQEQLLNMITENDYDSECKKTKVFKDKFIQYGGSATETIINKVFNNN